MKTIPAPPAIVTLLLLTISVPLTKENLLTAEEFYSMFKPDNSNHQFAVLLVTKASGEQPNPPPKGYDDKSMMKGDNYVANVYKKSTGHTEPTVLDFTNYLLNNFREKNPSEKPQLVLYTRSSPCCSGVKDGICGPKSCSWKINQFVTENGDALDFHLTWSFLYIRGLSPSNGQLLLSLNTMLLTRRVNIVSRMSLADLDRWFQHQMAECITVERKTRAEQFFENDFEGSVRKMINTLVWRMGTTQFNNPGRKVQIINDPDKWVDYLNGLLGRECDAFTSTIVKECHKKKKTRSCVVGPPLDPYTGSKASSRLEDLHGALDIEELNFILAMCNPEM